MGHEPVLSDSAAPELAMRVARVRREMDARQLDCCLISSPENIYYLTGLDHWGYFAPHMLILPLDGEAVLVTRAMEAVTIANQVKNARFIGHTDSETIADKVLACFSGEVEALQLAAWVRGAAGRGCLRIGLEKWTAGLPYALGEALQAGLPAARWVDISYMVDDIRLVKTAAEQAWIRQAARVSDAAMRAAIDAIAEGALEHRVAAACYRAMIEAGGSYPGFGPFIRPTARLGEEHTTWSDGALSAGDSVFIELSGCIRRYHAPMGRLIHVGRAPAAVHAMAAICEDAFLAVVEALRPGVLARDVYAAWQTVVDRAGLSHYRRHHCGYLVGIGCAPSWTGGNRVVGLRHDSDLEITAGMAFHILSWLMGTGRGDYFVSNTVLLTEAGAEVLSDIPLGVTVK